MAPKAAQMVCMTLGVIGLIGVITCCALVQWKVTIFIGTNSEQVIYEGLWMNCVMQATGQMHCRVFDHFEVMPSDLQAGRPITVTSCIFCGLSLLILVFGADFTPCVQNQGTKLKLLLVASVGQMLAGLLVIIPVSWSAHTIITDPYKLILMEAQRRELGAGIYIGWAAGVMLILTGVLLCCFGRPRSSSSRGTVKYHRASGLNDD